MSSLADTHTSLSGGPGSLCYRHVSCMDRGLPPWAAMLGSVWLSIGRVRVRCGELSSPELKEGDRRALETHPARLTCLTHSRKYNEAEIGV